jgi:hypothetical protein
MTCTCPGSLPSDGTSGSHVFLWPKERSSAGEVSMTLVIHAFLRTFWVVDLKDAIFQKYDPVVEVSEE